VIRFGLRLAVAGGREAVTWLVAVAVAVAAGVGLLLAILAGLHAVDAQSARYGWLGTGTESAAGTESVAPAPDPVWWLSRPDYFEGRPITRVDVAATGPDSPVPPGIPRLPGPGEWYASPALSALLASTPADHLADRYPGREVGTIGRAAVPDPGSLIVIVGQSPDQLAQLPGAEPVTSIGTTPPGNRAAALQLVLSVVAGGLLFPLLIFIGTATRLTAARREQRLAALRLVGATPRQVSLVSAVESTVATIAGTAGGFALFLLARPWLATIPFTGTPVYPGDLALSPAGGLLVALGIPAGAAAVALVALRRVRVSPLGVARRVTPRPPRAYRLIPLLLGIAELAYFVVGPRPTTSEGQTVAFLSGLLLVMVGLVVAGPWLTMVGARGLARRASRPAGLLAARRLADNPQAGFRAVSGLMLALFVTSVAVGVITTIVAHRGADRDDPAASDRLTAQVWPGETAPAAVPPANPDAVIAELSATPGVRSATVLREDPAEAPAGAPDLVPILSITVETDGSRSAIERARTILEVAYPDLPRSPATDADFESDFTRTLTGWQRLADVVILASLPIAGCSLAASVAGGISERKRAFSLLRLSGVPLRVLRRTVLLESAVPLLVVAVVAIGTGMLSAGLFLRAQMDYSLVPPGPGYYLIVLTGLAGSVGIIAATLPFLARLTGPESARNE
jgi:hypothetical protein